MKFEKMETLTYEQFSWFTGVSEEEGKFIIQLMSTKKWHLCWNECEHTFILIREKSMEVCEEN